MNRNLPKLLICGSGNTFLYLLNNLNEKNFFNHEFFYLKTNHANCNEALISKKIKVVDKDNFLKKLKILNDHLILSISIPFKIPRAVLDQLKIGIINFHSSALPNYRGMHPLNWSIINGEKKIGVTAHWMNNDFDAGPIIAQKKFTVDFYDDINSIKHKAHELILALSSEIAVNHLNGIKIPQGKKSNS